jgi:hypothetical protein
LKENKFKSEIENKYIVGPYNKLFYYFVEYYNYEKTKEGVSDFMK